MTMPSVLVIFRPSCFLDSGRIIFTTPEMGKVGRIATSKVYRGKGVAFAIMQSLHVSSPFSYVRTLWYEIRTVFSSERTLGSGGKLSPRES